MGRIIYKSAETDEEMEAVHKLNYKTFCEEIEQHPKNKDKKLVDRFHKENTYLTAWHDNQLVGMLAVRGNRPFSLDSKLQGLDSLLENGLHPLCEIRLLSVKKEYRRTSVIRGLMNMVGEYCDKNGYEAGVISGILEQQRLYRHLGFKPFGPVVGNDKARFQPMYIRKSEFWKKAVKKHWKDAFETKEGPLNLLPGPVCVDSHIAEAFARSPVSHRSDEFKTLLKMTSERLRKLSRSAKIAIMQGSGTLANDAIAAQIALLGTRGIIAVNGEFGKRLVEHAKGFNIDFKIFHAEEGEAFNLKKLRDKIKSDNSIKWLWAVHCETSTGMINPLEEFVKISEECNLKLCVDAISSIGCVNCDFRKVYLASGVSGKAIGSYPGIAIVFINGKLPRNTTPLPRYLDIRNYSETSVPFTSSSNLLYALYTALEPSSFRERVESAENETYKLKKSLQCFEEIRFSSPPELMNPRMVSLDLPKTISSVEVGEGFKKAGYHIAYESEHLIKKNRMQICFFGKTKDTKGIKDVLAEKTRKILTQRCKDAKQFLNHR